MVFGSTFKTASILHWLKLDSSHSNFKSQALTNVFLAFCSSSFTTLIFEVVILFDCDARVIDKIVSVSLIP